MTEDSRGKALVEWLARQPLDDAERAARVELVALFAANRRLREAFDDAGAALDALGERLRAEDQDAAGGHHTDAWLDGYRVGFAHAEGRVALWAQHMARCLQFAKVEDG